MKEVLVLGAGLVARPLVRYLLDTAGFGVTVASRTVEKGRRMISDHPNGRALPFDISKDENIKELVKIRFIAFTLRDPGEYLQHLASAKPTRRAFTA